MVSERPTGRDRSDSSIWLICVLTATLIITGICWRIHVSQIRQSKFTVDRNYDELNSTLQSKINEMEAKYKAVNETKAQICELLTSRRGQPCSEKWITNTDRCYYVSTIETSFHEAMQECSNLDSRLLEIDSRDEASFVTHKLVHRDRAYWIGKCEEGYNLQRPPAVSAKQTDGKTVAIEIGVSSARSRHLCSRIFLKRSRVSVDSHWRRRESSD
ncbi:C-type lectin domain family 7 member A-like isoform X2 [Mobula birostris]|uniref:C-type lectin domain family 7 member A-like isoform X2 n=1 Tax=Mobula birostris TaxID=1983395 RepID=UPI003B282856